MLNSEEISVEKIKSGIGGYKKKATQEFIETVRNDYEALCKENLELKDKLAILSEGVQYYKNMEKSLQKALVLAERTTSETMHAAEVKAVAMEKEAKTRADVVKKEAKIEAENYEKEAAIKAERMIREAKEQADMAIAEGNEELRRIHSKIMNLVQQYEQYKAQYKQLAVAQMNVLESEAYNLEAPILKSLQHAVEQGEKSPVKEKVQEEMHQDEVVQPVQIVSASGVAESDQQKGKKVYVDARGEVVEVHEFREVTIPHREMDPFKDEEINEMDLFQFDKNKGVERFDDEDDASAFAMNNSSVKELKNSDNAVEILKPQTNMDVDTSNLNFPEREENDKFVSAIDKLSKEHTRNVMFDTADEKEPFLETDNSMFAAVEKAQSSLQKNLYEEKNNDYFSQSTVKENSENDVSSATSDEKSQMSVAAMREIERVQLERLRQEEEQHARVLQQAQDRKSYFTMGNSTNEADEQKKIENDFYQNATFGNEKPEMSLHDIKMQEEEQNKRVPLPKASEENAYFSKSSNNANMPKASVMMSGEDAFFTRISEQDQQAQMSSFAGAEQKEKAMQRSDTTEEVLQQKTEGENTFFNQVMNSKNETGSFFEQFSHQTDGNVREIQNEESKNSLDFELDFNNGMPTTQNKESGFKSFRDFESEL